MSLHFVYVFVGYFFFRGATFHSLMQLFNNYANYNMQIKYSVVLNVFGRTNIIMQAFTLIFLNVYGLAFPALLLFLSFPFQLLFYLYIFILFKLSITIYHNFPLKPSPTSFIPLPRVFPVFYRFPFPLVSLLKMPPTLLGWTIND